MREFVERELLPHVDEWVEKGEYPLEVHRKFYDAGLGGAIYPAEIGGTQGVKHDFFHRLILFDELARCGGGMVFGQFSVNSMALPPIVFAGSETMKKELAPAVVRGEKFISLAVSEPQAGSDVSNLQTTATRSADGKTWTIS